MMLCPRYVFTTTGAINCSSPTLQGLLVKILVIKSHHFWLDAEHLQETIQNVLICVEMVFFSVLLQYAYHVVPDSYVEAKLN